MAEQIRVLVATRHGGSDVLEVQQRPAPQPGAGQLLLEVIASGVNFKEVYLREGRYPASPPFVLGDECAGRVVQVGDGVSGFAVGDVVGTVSARGAHASQTVIDAKDAVPVPDEVAPDIAAAALLQGMTAHYLVHSTYPVREGDAVLVHAAAGGVGQLLVQMAHTQGARVIGTVGSAAKVDVARAAGADDVIRYDKVGDLAAAIRDLVPDGVHVAYDGVGQATFEASLGALRRRGMLALFGASSGPVPPFDLQRLNPAGSLFVTRPTLGDYVAGPDELQWRAGDVLGAVANESLTISIGGRYRLEDAASAYDDLEGRRTTGKLLLEP